MVSESENNGGANHNNTISMGSTEGLDTTANNNIDNDTYGYCPQCKKANHFYAWCNSCDLKALVDKFDTWTTGNRDLDLFIQETQRTAEYYNRYLEYVPYDRFTDVKLLAQGGFAEVFTATWLDGRRVWKEVEESDKVVKRRTEPFTVALKVMNNSAKMERGFISELKLHHQLYHQRYSTFFPCYGITQDPKTMNYALILEYFPDGDLRRSLINSGNKLSWKDKLDQLWNICLNLTQIHDSGYIHRDIHSGNILLRYTEQSIDAYLTDFGLTQPADSPRSTKDGTYGVVPYMAPELFSGEPHSKETDIYAIGIIMSEYASNRPAFYDRDHDVHLQFEIIDGLRPKVPPETPECYRKLMNRCLSGDPKNRPTAKELRGLIFQWQFLNTNEARQFKMAANEQWEPREAISKHPGAIYTSRFITRSQLLTDLPVRTSKSETASYKDDDKETIKKSRKGYYLSISGKLGIFNSLKSKIFLSSKKHGTNEFASHGNTPYNSK